MRFIFYFLIFFLSILPLSASEVQSHGVFFEKWIRDTFFNSYEPEGYTQKWDIPKEANKKHGNVPVNPKAAKYRSSVGLGDAIRQYKISEPFLLIIGYWKKSGKNKKFVKVVAPLITQEKWRTLWGKITLEDLKKLDTLIKDRSLDYRKVRKLAKKMKKKFPFNTSIITLNPKIGSKGQRRLQCSLSFGKVFKYLTPEIARTPEERPQLFGVELPQEFHSPSRTFN